MIRERVYVEALVRFNGKGRFPKISFTAGKVSLYQEEMENQKDNRA